MDRSVTYSGEQGRSFDVLWGWRDSMEGIGQLEQLLAGATTTVVNGLTASQTGPASMSINLSAGILVQNAVEDATPYGSLPSSATLIQQIGFAAAQQVALTTAGLSAGQSQWALIEAQFAQVDVIRAGDPNGGLLYYYNSANPMQPLQGPGGNGQTQTTERQATISVRVVLGSPATTGSEVPPNADAGWVGLYLIDLTFGQTTITTGQILKAGPSAGLNVPSNYPGAPFMAGLLAAHHNGKPGQAPKIDLTQEVQNVLPLPNLPASDTLGGLPTMRLFAGNPNGNVAGNFNVNGAADFVWDSSNKILYVCTQTGTTSTAVWSAVVGQATSQFAGGTSTGAANAQVIASTTPAGFALTAGYVVNFTAGFTNSGAATLNVDATGAIAINKTSGGGPIPLTGGEIASGAFVSVIYTGAVYLIQSAQLGQLATMNLGQWVKNDGSGNLTLNVANVFQDNGSGALTLNPANATAALNAFVGDTGSGGTKGEVPAPSAGDAALKKVLGAGGAWVQNGPGAWGTRSGLKVVNGGSPDAQLTITARSACLRNPTTGEGATAINVNTTVTLTNSGAGGLDTGSPAANTLYYGFLIFDPTTNTINSLLSLSSTAPTLPAGYTFWDLVTCDYTDTNTHLQRMTQVDKRWQPKITTGGGSSVPNMPLLASGVAGNIGTASGTSGVPTWISVPLAGLVPPIAETIIGSLSAGNSSNGSNDGAIVAPNNAYGGVGSTTNRPPCTSFQTASLGVCDVPFEFVLEDVTQIFWAAAGNTAKLSLFGFTLGI